MHFTGWVRAKRKMCKQYYKIFNDCFIRIESIEVEDSWQKFFCYAPCNYNICFSNYENCGEESLLQMYDITAKAFLLKLENAILISDKKWKDIIIFNGIDNKQNSLLILRAFCSYIVQHHIIQLHSSLISTNNRGLMFLGPSGIGKTTQAELWNKYRDALIINGDIVFVQETEDAFLGWGTPWHGSSPYCENTSVPVHAMIVLKQAPENSIRELTGFEKVSEVSNSVFYPRWLENGMELCLETLDHLLSKIPVYELSCRPDEDAVRLVEETVFK